MSRIIEIGPKFLPALLTAEYGADCHLLELHITNDGSGDTTVGVYDGQTPAVPVIPTMTLNKTGIISASYGRGKKMIGGFFWQSTQAGCGGTAVLSTKL
jgi:hypothetical protein